MIGEWLAALESSAFAGALRGSVWAYPLVNAAHILGIALLVGAIVPLDLRLLGVWRSVPWVPLWRVLRTSAGVGLGIAALFGAMLFVTRATEYADSRLFIAKMMVVGVGLMNALLLNRIARKEVLPAATTDKLPMCFRIAGGVSIAAWLTALTLGRLVGYF